MEEADVGLQAGAAQSTLDHHSCVISDLYINPLKATQELVALEAPQSASALLSLA
jgi:hypothetical protein